MQWRFKRPAAEREVLVPVNFLKALSLRDNSELRGMLRRLDVMVTSWLYNKTILQKLEEENQDHRLCAFQILHLDEIKSIVEKVEAFGDKADYNGNLSQAEVAYTRLIKTWNRVGDRDRVNSLLLKLAKLHARNDDNIEAEEILRQLPTDDQVTIAGRDQWKMMVVDCYTRTSQKISELYQGSERYQSIDRGETGLNVKTPCPPFHRAIQHQMPGDVLSTLVSNHGDLPDIYRRRSIHIAIEADREDMVEKLVQLMPRSVHTRDSFQRTPLQLAVQGQCEHTRLRNLSTSICSRACACKFLMAAGADRNSRDAVGCTTLTMGARAGCPIIVKELLTSGHNIEAADVGAPLSFGQSTPLQAAAEEGHGDVVGILLSHGAKASVPRHDGKTAAMLASERGHFNLERRLKQAEEEEELENPPVWMGLIHSNGMYPDMGG
jgi:hypothetical protein